MYIIYVKNKYLYNLLSNYNLFSEVILFLENNLKTLLQQYDEKRNAEIVAANKRKLDFYKKVPELEKIDQNISSLSISSIKTLLTTNDKSKIEAINKRIRELKNEKQKILAENKCDPKYFEPKYECKKCMDTGFIKTSNGNILCSCIKQKLYNLAYNEANIYDLKSQDFDNFKLDYYSDEVDKAKYHFDISPRENIKSILLSCQNFINNFDNPSQNNLLFSGNTGLGKTFLSSCIANELIKDGKNVLYQTAPIMLDKILDYKFGKSPDNILKSIYSVDLLIIDDLGSETKSNIKLTELFNIINTRLLNQNNKITKTIISTNLSLQELYNTYEERIVSRIIGNYDACYFFGDDIRIKKKFALQ